MAGFVQTTYTINTGQAYAGLITDISAVTRIDSFENTSGAPIDFGLAVIRDPANEAGALLPTAPGDQFLGITVRELARENIAPIGSGQTAYVNGDIMNVLRTNGRIWVLVEDAVTAGGNVFFRTTAPGSEQLGAFRSDADGGDADQVEGAIFDTGAAAGELAVVLLGNT